MVAMSAIWLWWKERRAGGKKTPKPSPVLTPART